MHAVTEMSNGIVLPSSCGMSAVTALPPSWAFASSSRKSKRSGCRCSAQTAASPETPPPTIAILLGMVSFGSGCFHSTAADDRRVHGRPWCTDAAGDSRARRQGLGGRAGFRESQAGPCSRSGGSSGNACSRMPGGPGQPAPPGTAPPPPRGAGLNTAGGSLRRTTQESGRARPEAQRTGRRAQ